MSRFRAGKLDRNRLGWTKHLAPVQSVHLLSDVKAEDLVGAGKKLVLLDVDNTLVGWHSHEIPDSTLHWLASLREAGLQMCILSNTRKPARLARLAKEMNVPYLRGRFKPSRRMYRNALEKFGVSLEEAVMIGDQLFTDILGANRTGIDAIWVHQMTPKDFIGTKISRLGERLVRSRFQKAMIDELEIEGEAVGGDVASNVVGQFMKFAVVGGISTLVDWGLAYALKYGVHLGGSSAAAVPAIKAISTTVAACNSFILNRRWTFQIRGKEHRASHAQKFVIVTVIGLLLNTGITTVMYQVLPGSDRRRFIIAMAVATAVVMFWNFLGQKHWAFRHKH